MSVTTGKHVLRAPLLPLMFVVLCDIALAQSQRNAIAVEIFQVAGFPLNAQQASLVKTDRGYRFQCQLSNSSDSEMLGLRYSLALQRSDGKLSYILNRSEAFRLKSYETKKITFDTPLQIVRRDNQRVVAMFEQAVSSDSIWEVVKAKEAFEAYLSGDYSTVPTVMRVSNQIDAPIPTRLFFRN